MASLFTRKQTQQLVIAEKDQGPMTRSIVHLIQPLS